MWRRFWRSLVPSLLGKLKNLDLWSFAISICLLIFILRLLWLGLPADSHDEVGIYFSQAVQKDFRDRQWSPLYSMWYILVSWFVPWQQSFLAAQSLLPFVLLMGWFLLLVRLRWPVAVSGLITLVLAANPQVWFEPIKPVHFSLCLMTYFSLFLLLFKSRLTRLILFFPLAAVLVFARPENLLLFATGAIAIFLLAKKPLSLTSLALSFLLIIQLGLFEGEKAGPTYFKKQWQRLLDQGDKRFPSEFEFKAAYFPKSQNALAALFENPKVFLQNSLYGIKLTAGYVEKFFYDLYAASPALTILAAALIALAVAWGLWKRSRPKVNASDSLIIAALMITPCIGTALTYGTLHYYNLPLYFVITSLLLLTLALLPNKVQFASLLAASALFLANADAWYKNLHQSVDIPFGFSRVSSMNTISDLLNRGDIKVLSACGRLYNLISPQTTGHWMGNIVTEPETVKTPAPELLDRYDIVLFCEGSSYESQFPYFNTILQTIAAGPKQYESLRLDAIKANVLIRKSLFNNKPLPLGVRRIDPKRFLPREKYS